MISSTKCVILALTLQFVTIRSAHALQLQPSVLFSRKHGSCIRACTSMAAEPLKKGRPSPVGFTSSHVEGSEYATIEEEVEAMGGDSFFLRNHESTSAECTSTEDGEAVFEWDGAIDEDAYFD